jgi:hypothetical protein
MMNVLYFYISTFRNVCAVPSMTVFCSFLNSCFPVVLLTYFMNDFVVVPVAAVISGIILVCIQLIIIIIIIIIINGDTGNCMYSWCR